MKNTLVCLVWALFLGGTQGFTRLKWGRCPNLAVEQDFQLEQYLGTWYSQKTYNVEIYQGKNRCASAHYGLNENTGVVDVLNKQISTKTNQLQTVEGYAAPVNSEADEGRFEVTLNVKIWKNLELSVTGPYWVLGTDYETYTIVYGCENYLFLHGETVWVMSRNQNLNSTESVAFNKVTSNILAANDLNAADFEISDQSNCDNQIEA